MSRPKEFDPDKALERAMQLFWRQGYEATSVQDLTEAMGINRFSLYDTFGDKHRLFLAALDRYRRRVAGEQLRALEQAPDALAAIRRYFRDLLRAAKTPQGRRGCLVANTTAELAPHDPETAASVRAQHEWMDRVFYQALRRAQAQGQISKRRNLHDLARFLTTSAIGLSVRLKARPDRRALAAVVRAVLASL